MVIKTRPRAANAKIVTPHPRVLSGRPSEKVISNVLYGLQPFHIIIIRYVTRALAGRFLREKMMANADHI
jgi:hypothetical protein